MSLTNRLLDAVEARGYRLRRVFPGEAADAFKGPRLREFRRLAREKTTPGVKTTDLLGRPLRYYAGGTLSHLLAEIWCREIYRFNSPSPTPRVLDCGANIGLATLYFKRLFPGARVTAFEADPGVFETLSANVAAFGYDDVELVNKAVWTEATELRFSTDAESTAGRLGDGGSSGAGLVVPTVPLTDYLDGSLDGDPIDLLKLDIEGAETDVLLSVAERLGSVRNLFVEYHSSPGEPQRLHELLRVLAGAGLRVTIEEGGDPVRHPLVSPPAHKGFDMLLNVFATREG